MEIIKDIKIEEFIKNFDINSNALYMLPPARNNLSMGYLLIYHHKVILIDGGWGEYDYPQKKEILSVVSYNVDYQIITHEHCDHFGVLSEFLIDEDINVKNIYYNFKDIDSIRKVTHEFEIDLLNKFDKRFSNYKGNRVIVHKGTVLEIDDLKITFLNEPYDVIKDVNDTSLVFRIDVKDVHMLFLGDLSIKRSKTLIDEYKDNLDMLKADICQLAHHGQNGGSFDLYQIINMKYALWSGPKWIFDNDLGKGPNSGNLTSRETEEWMKKLNATNVFAWFDITKFVLD